LIAQPDTIPVRRIFTRVGRLLADDLASRRISFKTRVEPETLQVTADPELLDQALINLIRNAMEALSDTRNPVIHLSAVVDSDKRIAISVADNGPGIPRDLREKVFVPFFTTKRQGNGVGLTLVRQIATVHDAQVQVSDSVGGGATISLRF